ncbi:MAG: ABC transporter substrate-binding protein [Acholeplasmataceae bacterium]
MKKFYLILLVLVAGFALMACESSEGTQGITDDEIIIGNTAATSGLFAGVGVPFNLAMQVVFDDYNETHDGRDINFIHYDDGFDGATGLSYTKKLVEEDNVFALVGHFGTNTVNATMDYLLESGVPMVYGVTGVNSLYYENDLGNNILSVQPIYRTEGKMLVARTLHESLFGANGDAQLGANDNIVVLYSDDDAGQSIKVGIVDQVAAEGIGARVTYLPFATSTASAVATVALGLNPEAIILSSNQAPATAMTKALREQGSTIPVLSSYVNGATVFTPAMLDATTALPFEVYANAWVDISDATGVAPTAEQIGGDGTLSGWPYDDFAYLAGYTAEYWDTFVHDMNSSDRVDGDTAAIDLWANSYAIAGYIAAKTFVTLLERVTDFDTLTWESFIALAESAPVDLPMAGSVNWADGNRMGLDMLALNQLQYSPTTAFKKVFGLESLATVVAK